MFFLCPKLIILTRILTLTLFDKLSPVAYALTSEVHWYDFDVRYGGIKSMLREIQCIPFVTGGW